MSKERLEEIYQERENGLKIIIELIKEDKEKLEQQNKRYREALYFLELKLSDFKKYTNKIKKLSDEKMIKDYAVRFLEDISETEQALKEENK